MKIAELPDTPNEYTIKTYLDNLTSLLGHYKEDDTVSACNSLGVNDVLYILFSRSGSLAFTAELNPRDRIILFPIYELQYINRGGARYCYNT